MRSQCFTRMIGRSAVAWLLACACVVAVAADGITETTLKVGMSAPLSGTAGAYGRQMRQGIEACLARVNAAGGVHGRRIELVSLDDGYEPAAAVANTRRLIGQDKVFALVGFYGTASTLAVSPVLERAGVPLIGTVTGAEALRSPDNHHIFHLRASYGDETAAIVRNLTTVGITRLAVFYQDDGFGQSGYDGLTRALAQHGLKPVAVGSVPRNSTQVAAAVKSIAGSNAQAVVMVALAPPAAAFIRGMHVAGARPFFVALSPVGTDQLVSQLTEADTRGVEVAQVMPHPLLEKVGVVREYRRALAELDPSARPAYYGVEGYLDAKLLVAALDRAGRNVTRESLVSALHASEFDLGDYRVNFSRPGNAGSSYVEISVVGEGGRILN